MTPKEIKEFWGKVRKTEGCWIWEGSRHYQGYGQFGIKQKRAHRIAWELICGPIPIGLNVLHNCDNPPCVRVSLIPEESHLFLGTQKKNMEDAAKKGRMGKKKGGDLRMRGKNENALVPVMIMFQPKEKEKIRKKAKELGLNNMSAYVRWLVHRDLRDIPEKRRTA